MPHKDPVARAEYHKAYRERNQERLSAVNKACRERDLELIVARKRQEYERHKEAYKARAKAYSLANAERIRAYRATQTYKDAKNARRRAAYVPHPLPPPKTREQKLADKRADYQRNKKRYKERFRANYAKHPERAKLYQAKKPYWRLKFERSLSKATGKQAIIEDVDSIRAFYMQVYTQQEATCDYCRGRFPIREIIVEHKQPYALGGVHSVSNFAVSCNPCNLAKGTEPYEKWIAYRK